MTLLPFLLAFIAAPSGMAGQSSESAADITVGNHFLSRVFRVEAGQAFTVALQGRGKILLISREFQIVCDLGGREVILDGRQTRPSGYTRSPDGREVVLTWAAEEPALEIRASYRSEETQPYIFKTLEVANRGTLPIRLRRATIDDLEMESDLEPMRGGVGQPVFLRHDFFLGIEHPAAANEILGRGVRLSQFPYAEIKPGVTWVSERAVLGAATGAGASIEDAFREYILAVSGRNSKAAPIYCDWAAHDELGTLVKPQLTERLVDTQLDALKSLAAQEDVRFDYYLMDAFWYDPKGAYLDFKKPNWPRGYEPALRHMLELGLKPGLWFDLGGSTLDLKDTPGWSGPEKPCLADPAFAQLLERAFEYHIGKHSLAMLKFDFTNLYCRHGGDAPSLAVLERNADALRKLCDRARQLNPAIIIRAYNTFSLTEMMSSTKYWDEAYAVSPWWLLWFDSVYSGDPRPSDLPSVTSLRDSVDWYQDHVSRGYFRSLMPAPTLDDCGILVGKTSTIYYLGAEGFTDAWILNVLRGGMMPTFYGDLTLLTPRDRNFLAATLRFLRDHQQLIARTRPILGVPGKGEVYGYQAQDSALTLITLVNPGLFRQSFSVEVADLPRAAIQKLIFSNDAQAPRETRESSGLLTGKLVPGEIRVYALGEAARIAPLALPSAPTRMYHEVAQFPDPFGKNQTAELKIGPQHRGKTLAIVVSYWKGGEADRAYGRPQEVMKLKGKIDSRPVTFSSIPREGTDIWSRSSWAVFKHRVAPEEVGHTLRLNWEGNPPEGTAWTITALWLGE